MPLELPEGWRDQLPDEIKTNGVLDDVKTIDQMANMIVKGRQLQTHQISIPSEDASPEKRDEFLKDLQNKIPDLVYVGEGADMGTIYDRMGRPKEATGYELGDLPDPLKPSFDKLTSTAHEAGVNAKQMKAITDAILGDYTANLDIATNQMDESIGKIKQEFGEATEDKLRAAERFAKQLGFDENFADALGKGAVGLDNLKAFDKVMAGFESSGPRIGEEFGAGPEGRLTPEAAEMQLSEIMGNKDHPYWDGASPAHKASVNKVVELTRAADAGKAQTETEKFRDALQGRG